MDKQEFKSLVLPSKGKLYRIALSLLASREEAEDTLQDVFLKLWHMRAKLSQYNSIEALAVTMTKNLCFDKLRSYKHRKQDEGELENLPIKATRPNPAVRMELSESSAEIHRLIQELSEQQQLVMHLRDIEQYSYDEIEKMTGLKRNAIRVNLSRARKNVREAYLKKQNYEHRKD
jgi:RNA polymerase sigma-70 factor (ECF subfamily)